MGSNGRAAGHESTTGFHLSNASGLSNDWGPPLSVQMCTWHPSSWAQLIKRIYEVDPLVCPSCGGEMKVIAFITEHDVVDAILRHFEHKQEQWERGPPS